MLRPTPGDPWGVEQHHWNTGAEENQQLNPGGPSNRQNFKFYLGKLNKKKKFPIWCNVNFVSVFAALNNIKKQRKFSITPYGEIFYQLTYRDKI